MLYDVDRDCFVKVAPYDLCNGDMFTLPPTLVLLPRCVGARSGMGVAEGARLGVGGYTAAGRDSNHERSRLQGKRCAQVKWGG